MKVKFTISMDKELVDRVDKLAGKLTDGNRSQLIENLVDMGMMDADLLKRFGLLQVARTVQRIGDKFDVSGVRFSAKR